MSVNRAVAIAAAADRRELRSLYGRAVSHGAANTLCTPEEERAHGTLRLLTLATLRLPDLYLYAHLLEALDEDATVEPVPPIVTSQLGELAAGALRLAHRALETHAHELGYQTGRWVERALERAHERLCGDLESRERPLVDEARRCAIALTRAIAATAGEPMLVPGELADALARLLVLYLIVTTHPMTGRLASGRAGLRVWVARWLTLGLPLALLALATAAFALAPSGIGQQVGARPDVNAAPLDPACLSGGAGDSRPLRCHQSSRIRRRTHRVPTAARGPAPRGAVTHAAALRARAVADGHAAAAGGAPRVRRRHLASPMRRCGRSRRRPRRSLKPVGDLRAGRRQLPTRTCGMGVPGRDQRDRDQLRPQPLGIHRRRDRLDADHARHLGPI